jgi:hypothetical protein
MKKNKKHGKIEIDFEDALTLGITALDLPKQSSDLSELEEALTNRYEMSFEAFRCIADLLIQFTPVVESPLTGEKFHAFIDNDGIAIAKAVIKSTLP